MHFRMSLRILFTCTTGEFESWARASRMLTLVFRCCPDPIPPTYRCRQPRAREWPVLLITSLADFRLQSQHVRQRYVNITEITVYTFIIQQWW